MVISKPRKIESTKAFLSNFFETKLQRWAHPVELIIPWFVPLANQSNYTKWHRLRKQAENSINKCYQR